MLLKVHYLAANLVAQLKQVEAGGAEGRLGGPDCRHKLPGKCGLTPQVHLSGLLISSVRRITADIK